MTHPDAGNDADRWLWVDTGPGGAAFNMGFDEAMLIQAAGHGVPLLRFYSWEGRPASFGYSQRHAEVEHWTLLRPLVRRPTGGGLVPHDTDWTYSVAFPPTHRWYGLRATDSYREIHEWIRDSFEVLGIPTELSPCCRPEMPGQCFVGAEKSDLLWHGRKIAGAAQRRNRLGLLIQGSVQPPPTADTPRRAPWQEAMLLAGSRRHGAAWWRLEPGAMRMLQEAAARLAEDRYSLESYTRQR